MRSVGPRASTGVALFARSDRVDHLEALMAIKTFHGSEDVACGKLVGSTDTEYF